MQDCNNVGSNFLLVFATYISNGGKSTLPWAMKAEGHDVRSRFESHRSRAPGPMYPRYTTDSSARKNWKLDWIGRINLVKSVRAIVEKLPLSAL